MKKIITVLILICIVALLALDVKIIMGLNYITEDLTKEIEFLQTQINDLKKENTKVDEVIVEETAIDNTLVENVID